ncbi:thiamine-phosphate kinase [soil metagenome]
MQEQVARSPSERDIIDGFRAQAGGPRDDVELGIGDDGAVLIPPRGRLIAVVDTLVSGVHFPAGLPACFIGHRALAVNLSDIAAMGGTSAWATLALTMPAADAEWLEDFRRGFFALADAAGVALVGGDTTRGPLSVTVQLLGSAPDGWIPRAGAEPGDVVCVSGTLGDAAAGLALLQDGAGNDADAAWLLDRFRLPAARSDEGRSLLGIASAAIDISDGLISDAGKLAAASSVGARIEADRLPLSRALRERYAPSDARRLALAGGDDYELCFTVPAPRVDDLERIAARWECCCTRIGVIETGAGVRCVDARGRPIEVARGYDHFAA